VVVVYGYPWPFDRRFHRDAVVGLGLGSVCLVSMATVLRGLRGPVAGGRFLGVGGAVLVGFALVGAVLRQRTRSRAGSQPLTLATWVTLSRGVLGAVFAGLAAAVGFDGAGAVAWLPGLVFGLAAALDRVDGWLARARDERTPLGDRLDIETDAILVFLGAVAVVGAGLAPAAFLAVGLARYLLLLEHAVRRYRGRRVGGEHRRWLNRLAYVALVVAVWLATLPVTESATTRPLLSVVGVLFLANFLRSWWATGG
jgi:CDP-diacylglycerol--glycerol-3-phosphate 3-phosphatidyltransferase